MPFRSLIPCVREAAPLPRVAVTGVWQQTDPFHQIIISRQTHFVGRPSRESGIFWSMLACRTVDSRVPTTLRPSVTSRQPGLSTYGLTIAIVPHQANATFWRAIQASGTTVFVLHALSKNHNVVPIHLGLRVNHHHDDG